MRFLAAKRQLCLVAVTLSLAVALSACSSRVVLKSIPAEVIPQELKDSVQRHGTYARPLVSNVVWRVYEIKDGRLFAACTFVQEYAPGVGTGDMMYCVWTSNLDEAGHMTGPMSIGTGSFRSGEAFQGGHGGGDWLSDTGERTYSLIAGGYCLDGRVKAIQGTTTEGQTVKTKPSGGFWALELYNAGPTEAWAKISGIDWRGRPIVDLEIRPRPWEGS
ncbi:MAG: hypothetical protein WD024_08630 [Bacillota bacterium]